MDKIMEKSKSILKQLLVPLIICLVIGIGFAIIMLIPEKEDIEESIPVYSYVEDKGEYVLENDKLKFVLDAETTRFAVTQKDSNYTWYSNPLDADEDTLALASDKDNLKSTVIISYKTKNGVTTTFNNYNYSVTKGIYEIETGEDFIKVYYSIGETEKEFVIPPVISEERMEIFFGNMGDSEIKQIKEYYRKYDINNLKSSDNKEQLLSTYPMLENEITYIIRDGVKDYMKEKIEGYFEAAGYTFAEYQEDLALYSGGTKEEKPVFNLSVVYRIENGDLLVELPMEDIAYNPIYPITSVNVLPYMGAASIEEEGYMFVPEGGGAIINFNNGKLAQNSYYSNVYGWDYAQGKDSSVHETQTAFNVFGISNAKAKSSFICMLEDGASYANISADISGRYHNYNYVNASYSVIHAEAYDVSSKSNEPVYVFEQKVPQGSLKQRYRFVDSDDYVDMAYAYQEYLLSENEEMVKKEDTSTPVVVEVVGAVDKVQQVLGFPKSVPLPLTTYKEAYDMIDQMSQSGFENMAVKLTGWANGGVRQSVLNKVDLVSKLGSKKELQKVINYTKSCNIPFYMDGVVEFAYNSDIWEGFIAFRDAAKYASDEKVELYNFSLIWYGEETWNDSHYLLKPEKRQQMINNLKDATLKYGATGVSFRDAGNYLSADYNTKDVVTREESLRQFVESAKNIKDSGLSIMINHGNEYAVGYADYVTNMDLKGSQYTILDESIPFYQIALHSYVNYTGEAVNLAKDYQQCILESAESGASLYWVFMKEEAIILQDTLYTQYYGADFDSWYEKALDIYREYEGKLGHTFNQKIVDHKLLSEDVTVTVYEDGTKVYVNYGSYDYNGSGITVSARSYSVENP